jgi:hypothetical protein
MTKSFLIVNVIWCVFFGFVGIAIRHYLGTLINTIAGVFQLIYALFAIVLVVVIRNVKDAFFIKREFTGLSITLLTTIVLLFLLNRVGPDDLDYGYIVLPLFVEPVVMFCFSFVVPLALSYKYQKEIGSSTKTSGNSLSTEDADTDKKEDFRTLAAVLEQPVLAEAFVEHIRKHFEVEKIFFLMQLAKWKESPSDQMAGKALLMYQKFIKPNSLLDLQIEPELRQDIEELLLDEEKLLAASIDKDFFHQIEQHCRDRLDGPLKEFRHTPEFARVIAALLEETRLDTGMKEVGIVN